MLRGPIAIRDAVPSDAEALLDIWSGFSERTEKATARPLPPASEVRAAVSRGAAEPAERLVVAELDGEIVGVAQLLRSPISPIHVEDAVRVNFLHVLPDHRRRGIGRMLLECAVDWADEKDTDHVLVSASSASRDGNRFLARLGLAPYITVRTSTVKALRSRLVARDGSQLVTNVVAARRLMRRRADRLATGLAPGSALE
jgi:GNAT superfamily N-acetyltransferase